MADFQERIREIVEKSNNRARFIIPEYQSLYNALPKIPTVEFNEENTFTYQMQQQTNQIIEKSNEQINLLIQQNERLENNYKKLEELYNLKEKELQDAKKIERKAKVYNVVMMLVAIVSMLIAIAAWLIPNDNDTISAATKVKIPEKSFTTVVKQKPNYFVTYDNSHPNDNIVRFRPSFGKIRF